MLVFKVIESIMRIGPRKGQKSYSAVPKAPLKFSSKWLVERIVRETSLSEGDVRNVIITLRNIVIEIKCNRPCIIAPVFKLPSTLHLKVSKTYTCNCRGLILKGVEGLYLKVSRVYT